MLDCLVIGAGPAGLTAAIYLLRFHRNIRLVGGTDSRALQIPRTRNYPGFPDGVSGQLLLQRMRQQLVEAGAAEAGCVSDGEVDALERREGSHGGSFIARAGSRRIEARTVLLATGVRDVQPTFAGIEALRRRSLLRQCPICDAHEFTGRRLIVVGRGDHGAREALFLRHFSDKVVLVDARADAPAGATMRAALAGADVQYHGAVPELAQLAELAGQCRVRLLLGDGQRIEGDVVYAALGSLPRCELVRPLGAELDRLGNVVTDAHGLTSVPGLYAAGDVVSALDQIAVAVGHGAVAATAIHNALSAG